MSDDGWREPWWIPDESPGGIGAPEVWIDAATLDSYGGKDPRMVHAVLSGNGGGPWIGALVRFARVPPGQIPQQVLGVDDVFVYMVVGRRWDQGANGGRPYYVAKFPDSLETP